MMPLPLSRRAFTAYHAHLIPNAADAVLKFKHAPRVLCTTYQPGKPRLCGDQLNTYTPPNLKPAAGDWSNTRRLIGHLFPTPSHRDHVLRVLAFVLRHPGVKIRHALLIRGPQGSGKNTLLEIISYLVGSWNVRIESVDVMSNRFTDTLSDIQILGLDEVLHTEGWDIYNRLKPIISEDSTAFEGKGKARRCRATPQLVILMSNDETPLPLDAADRRFFCPGLRAAATEPGAVPRDPRTPRGRSPRLRA